MSFEVDKDDNVLNRFDYRGLNNAPSLPKGKKAIDRYRCLKVLQNEDVWLIHTRMKEQEFDALFEEVRSNEIGKWVALLLTLRHSSH